MDQEFTSKNLCTTLSKDEHFPYRYSVCTLFTKPQEYTEMLQSFLNAGFDCEYCEYLCIDNSAENTVEAFEGLNLFLRKARGEFIILCHQDILLHDADIRVLNQRIEEITELDPKWAVLGNAGGLDLHHRAKHLSRKTGQQLIEANLPLKAITLDENFMVVKNNANLSLSADLSGFHLYGTDLCLLANTLGYTNYVINFNILHKSGGTIDQEFHRVKVALIRKYRRAFRGRYICTTATRFYISGNFLANIFFNSRPILFLFKQLYKAVKSKKCYQVIKTDDV